MQKREKISKLFVFTSPTCKPCHKAIQDLKNNNIEFEEVDVNKNPELVKKYFIRSSPTFVGLDNKGYPHSVYGYKNIAHIKEAFNI